MSRYPYSRWVFILPLKSLNHSRKKKNEHQNRKKGDICWRIEFYVFPLVLVAALYGCRCEMSYCYVIDLSRWVDVRDLTG